MRKRSYVLVMTICLVVSLFCLAYPMYVIRPFRFQGARELAIALVVLRYRTVVTALCAVAAIAALIPYWRAQHRWLRKISAAIAVLFVGAFTWLSHVNVFELMFHPVGAPAVGPAAEAKLDGGEMVLAVQLQGESRAYPVRSISYHHIVNDTVGGVPIVATY
jgi:hypothetical protein